MADDPLRYARDHDYLHPVFGADRFGEVAEKIARFLGTPQYLVGQSALVAAWIAFNAIAISAGWDPYPFILLNLAFSTQAAYAAPLILLAQTRQADRDKAHEESAARHRDDIASNQQELLQQNTDLTEKVKELTEQVAELTRSIYAHVVAD